MLLLDFERENYQLPAISPTKKGKKGNDNAVHSLAAGIWSLWPADSVNHGSQKKQRHCRSVHVLRLIQDSELFTLYAPLRGVAF